MLFRPSGDMHVPARASMTWLYHFHGWRKRSGSAGKLKDVACSLQTRRGSPCPGKTKSVVTRIHIPIYIYGILVCMYVCMHACVHVCVCDLIATYTGDALPAIRGCMFLVVRALTWLYHFHGWRRRDEGHSLGRGNSPPTSPIPELFRNAHGLVLYVQRPSKAVIRGHEGNAQRTKVGSAASHFDWPRLTVPAHVTFFTARHRLPR